MPNFYLFRDQKAVTFAARRIATDRRIELVLPFPDPPGSRIFFSRLCSDRQMF